MTVMVSINCITYNHEKYIVDAIEGFLMQKTNFNYEILIGEDFSKDNTRIIVEEYAKRYPNKISVITSNKNVGARKNALRLIENSKGKYIAVCEGDDYWTDPYKLQKQVDYLEKNPDCTLCFHSVDIVQQFKSPTGLKMKPYSKDKVSLLEDIILGGGGFCPTSSLIYPRKLMENPPSFFLTAHVGDYPIQLILSSLGYAYYFDDCMSVYRTGVEGSWTSKMNTDDDLKRKMIGIHEGDIQILHAFDEYTKSKYSKSVSAAILEKEFILSTICGNKNYRNSYSKKQFMDRLSFKKRLKIRLRYNYPKTYIKFAELKNFIYSNKVI